MGHQVTLTDDEKAHIREEEEFRAELRREFAEKKPNRGWAFLNSAFGLWLLGSVSLGLITFLYQKLDSSYKATAERNEIQRKVREELRTRFNLVEAYTYVDRSQPCIQEPNQPPTPELTSFLLKTANGEDGGAYEEFRRVSATALFSQLFQLENVSDYQKLPEREKQIFIARENWIYLEPKLRLRAIQPQLDVQLTCYELYNRFGKIAESFR